MIYCYQLLDSILFSMNQFRFMFPFEADRLQASQICAHAPPILPKLSTNKVFFHSKTEAFHQSVLKNKNLHLDNMTESEIWLLCCIMGDLQAVFCMLVIFFLFIFFTANTKLGKRFTQIKIKSRYMYMRKIQMYSTQGTIQILFFVALEYCSIVIFPLGFPWIGST